MPGAYTHAPMCLPCRCQDEAEEGEEPEVTDAQATVTSEEERAQLLEAKRRAQWLTAARLQ